MKKGILLVSLLFLVGISLVSAQESVQLSKGWNFVSFPADFSITQIIPPNPIREYSLENLGNLAFFHYDVGSNSWIRDTTTPSSARAYWIESADRYSLTIEYTSSLPSSLVIPSGISAGGIPSLVSVSAAQIFLKADNTLVSLSDAVTSGNFKLYSGQSGKWNELKDFSSPAMVILSSATGYVFKATQSYTLYLDKDSDGFISPEDCDDNDASVYPGAPEICDGKDNNCNGQIDEGTDEEFYSGPEGTNNVGECKAGLKSCVDGQLGVAREEIIPITEICNGKDDDCNGNVDDNLLVIPCYSKESSFIGVGTCKMGTKKCVPCLVDNDCGAYVCEGEITPVQEICDSQDNDCNGQIDDAFDFQTDTANCGQCGINCNLPNAQSICEEGQCRFFSCNQGFARCDNNDENGCETNIDEGVANCGHCGTQCLDNKKCFRGFCVAQDVQCGDGICSENEVCPEEKCCYGVADIDTQTDMYHCGSCDKVCYSGTCINGKCKKEDGESCEYDSFYNALTNAQSDDCIRGYCVHGYCRSIPTDCEGDDCDYYCGDDLCDYAEVCPDDCPEPVTARSYHFDESAERYFWKTYSSLMDGDAEIDWSEEKGGSVALTGCGDKEPSAIFEKTFILPWNAKKLRFKTWADTAGGLIVTINGQVRT